MNRHLSRRRFLAAGAAATTAGLESLAHAYPIRSANEKLNIAMVGVGKGGVGGVLNLPRMARENIVAMCDIDEQYAGPNFEKYPKAKRWTDFRRMLDRRWLQTRWCIRSGWLFLCTNSLLTVPSARTTRDLPHRRKRNRCQPRTAPLRRFAPWRSSRGIRTVRAATRASAAESLRQSTHCAPAAFCLSAAAQ